MTNIISFILSLFTALALMCEGIPYAFRPTLLIDASVSEGEISSRASGFLYGTAQNGVPDAAAVESIDVSSVSQKVIGGLQHPIGDVDNVAPMLDNCDYITVYLQDCFDTWYYCHDEIMALRAAGEYDCAEFVETRFLPEVRKSAAALEGKPYSDRLVYCLYNETDNAVWFGTPSEDGTWLMFDDAAKQRFYEAWKVTFELVRSIDPDAVIGGPGYCDFDVYELEHFLSFCKANNCLPDIMIYHELGESSALYWEEHVEQYRELEKRLGIAEMPIIVTEYGTMYECGAPADMLKYIVGIEKSGTWANAAYWRLANNLCDTVADNNSPNSNWWLFRWYADMQGQLLNSRVIDVLHADFANVIKYNYDRFHYRNFNGMASLNDAENEMTVLCGGCDYGFTLNLKNIDETNLGKTVNVKIESVCFEGLSGVVNSPTLVAQYTDKVSLGKLKIKLDSPDPTAVYRVTLTPAAEEKQAYYNDNLPVRYEFEHGTRTGGCYTYDSAYATTGETQGMVGGLENKGDSVSVNFTVEKDGVYDLSLIFGNSNDGATPNDRADTRAVFTLDGVTEDLYFPNTIKSEYTDKMTLARYLEKGSHTVTLAHGDGTFVVDSMIVKLHENIESISLISDEDRTDDNTQSYLAGAPYDGFYLMTTDTAAAFEVDGALGITDGETLVYLRRGFNYIDFNVSSPIDCKISTTDESGFSQSVSPESLALSDGAVLTNGHIEGISSLGGKAEFTVTVPKAGDYRLTLAYANNDEGGVHSYNVDLIERYVTVESVGKTQTLWCRNTYSWDTVKTVTMNIALDAGENTVTFTNDGSVSFNSTVSYAPHIYSVTVNAVSVTVNAVSAD